MNLRVLAFASAAFAIAAPAAAQIAPVPAATLARAVDIPFKTFTLPNGLRVIVHTDRKAPIVAVSGLVRRRLEARAHGQDRLRASVRASDVQRQRECAGRFLRAAEAGRRDRLQRHDLASTAPIISRRCRPPRSIARCSSKATAWAICSARSRRASSTSSAASSRTRSGRATTSPMAWSSTSCSRGCSRRAPLSPLDDRLDGRSRSPPASTTSRTGSATHYGPNNAVLVLAGDIDVATAQAAGREIFRRHPARARDRSCPSSPCRRSPRPVDRDDEGPRRRDADLAQLGGAGPQRPERHRARRRCRACSAAWPARGSTMRWSARRSSRSRRRASYPDMAQVGIFSISVDRQARRSIRRWSSKRLDEIIADLLATGPTADEVQSRRHHHGGRAHSRAGIGRRFRRQGGHARAGRALFGRSRASTRRSCARLPRRPRPASSARRTNGCRARPIR